MLAMLRHGVVWISLQNDRPWPVTIPVTIEVQACSDCLRTGYDYGVKVCPVLLVMERGYQSALVSHVRYMTHS